MKRKRFSEEQITACLNQAEAGVPIKELCRQQGFTEQTFYRWKRQFAGMGIAELRELKDLRDQCKRLKRLVADLTLDKQMLQEVVKKKF
jgi:putative transposase